MKEFIKKISKGSSMALFLEVLLVIQVVVMVYTYVTRPECTHNDYSGDIQRRGDYYD